MTGRRRSPLQRLARGVLFGLAAFHVAEGLWLRRRRASLVELPTTGAGSGSRAGRAEANALAATPLNARTELVAVTAPAVTVSDELLTRVADEMAATGAEVVDLVPQDLPVERALRLLRRVDPARVERDAMAAPGGAQEALVLHPATAARMSVTEATEVRDRGELLRLTVRAQRYAPTSTVVRIAPGLAAGPADASDRWRELEESKAAYRNHLSLPAVVVGAESAYLALLAGGLLVAPVAGAAALAMWCLQPALVFAGRRGPHGTDSPGLGMLPPDLGTAGANRLLRRWVENMRTVVASYRSTRAAARVRAAGAPPAVPAHQKLFEPRREDCPWCGSEALIGVLDTPDLVQSKPGRFHLDECGGCGHIFQNPRLSPAGLDYYYKDFYDGPGQEQWEGVFAGGDAANRDRLHAVTRVAEPRTWLDVGTGYGHFCLVAQQERPDVVFDGLDMGTSVAEAERRGWVNRAHQGLFPELADGLPRSYDVVSMHHYLEHTPDPRRELKAAAKVLEPGGHLEIEVPDPESPWARRLGRGWFCWMQPQHLHFLPCRNLVKALEEVGFEVVSIQRSEATLGGDALGAVLLTVEGTARSPHAPWLSPPSALHRVKRAALVTLAAPALFAAGLVDLVAGALRPSEAPGNAYRVVARRC